MLILKHPNRLGRFRIDAELIEQQGVDSLNFEELLKLIRNVLILEAKYCPSSDSIKYVGLSRQFDVTEKDKPIPVYDVVTQTIRRKPGEYDNWWCEECRHAFNKIAPSPVHCPWCGREAVDSHGKSYREEVQVGFKRRL